MWVKNICLQTIPVNLKVNSTCWENHDLFLLGSQCSPCPGPALRSIGSSHSRTPDVNPRKPSDQNYLTPTAVLSFFRTVP